MKRRMSYWHEVALLKSQWYHRSRHSIIVDEAIKNARRLISSAESNSAESPTKERLAVTPEAQRIALAEFCGWWWKRECQKACVSVEIAVPPPTSTTLRGYFEDAGEMGVNL